MLAHKAKTNNVIFLANSNANFTFVRIKIKKTMSSVAATFKKVPRTFWIANTIELFERWAWYGFFMLFANYLTGSTDDGGLQFS